MMDAEEKKEKKALSSCKAEGGEIEIGKITNCRKEFYILIL